MARLRCGRAATFGNSARNGGYATDLADRQDFGFEFVPVHFEYDQAVARNRLTTALLLSRPISGFRETCTSDRDPQILKSTHHLKQGAGFGIENLRHVLLEHVLCGDHRHFGCTVFERAPDQLEFADKRVTVRFKAGFLAIQR